MITKFIIFLIAGLGSIGFGSYSIYKSFTHMGALSNNSAKILLWLLTIMPLIFIGTTIIGGKYNLGIARYLYAISSVWLTILTYFFISAIILTILNTILSPQLLNPNLYKIITICFITISLVLVLYGIINAQIVRKKFIIIPKENRLSEHLYNKKIILFSDTHIGNINNKNYLKKIVKEIESENPDIVIFAGDLIDGPKINLEKSLENLKYFTNKENVYYASGNHEVYSSQEKELYTLTDKYMTSLRNSKTTIEGIDIVGVSYDAYETGQALYERLERSGYDSQKPTIAIVHDPKNNAFLQDKGVDLIVSGHTHGGQFWPFTKIVERIFGSYAKGITHKNNTTSITTTGTGTWGPPVRIGSHAEIVIINFEK